MATGLGDTTEATGDHLVQFYQHDSDLVPVVIGYLFEGIEAEATKDGKVVWAELQP